MKKEKKKTAWKGLQTIGDCQESLELRSRGYNPHQENVRGCVSLTFRLADSLPRHVIQEMQRETQRLPLAEKSLAMRRMSERYLDMGLGSCCLGEPEQAEMVQAALLYFHGRRYHVFGFVIMPNHVHALMQIFSSWSLKEILHSIKSYTGNRGNRLLGVDVDTRFWARGYFDRWIRDEKHFDTCLAYIEANPVKANLCSSNEQWRFSSAIVEIPDRFSPPALGSDPDGPPKRP